MLQTSLVPAAEKSSDCLMIVLHGLGDSAEGYRWLPGEMKFSWMNYLLVNAPDTYYSGYSWYDFAGDPVPGIRRSTQTLLQLLDQCRDQGYPALKTTVFGFSQGCLMAMEVGLRYPHLLAGIVGVSGYVHEPESLLLTLSPVAKQQRFLFTHGRQDPLIPFAEVKQQVEMLRATGIQIKWVEFDKPHTIAGEAELKVIKDFVRDGYGRVGE